MKSWPNSLYLISLFAINISSSTLSDRILVNFWSRDVISQSCTEEIQFTIVLLSINTFIYKAGRAGGNFIIREPNLISSYKIIKSVPQRVLSAHWPSWSLTIYVLQGQQFVNVFSIHFQLYKTFASFTFK